MGVGAGTGEGIIGEMDNIAVKLKGEGGNAGASVWNGMIVRELNGNDLTCASDTDGSDTAMATAKYLLIGKG